MSPLLITTNDTKDTLPVLNVEGYNHYLVELSVES